MCLCVSVRVCVCLCVRAAGQRETDHWVHGNTLRVCMCVEVTTLVLSSAETGGKTEKRIRANWKQAHTHTHTHIKTGPYICMQISVDIHTNTHMYAHTYSGQGMT